MILRSQSGRRFLRYTLVGAATFAVDLLILAALTEFLALPYAVSTPIGFLSAVSLNYILSRSFVFKGSIRPFHQGYLYFILIAVGAATFITGTVMLLVNKANMHYLPARVLVAGVAGVGNYVLNLYLNFKVAGNHQP